MSLVECEDAFAFCDGCVHSKHLVEKRIKSVEDHLVHMESIHGVDRFDVRSPPESVTDALASCLRKKELELFARLTSALFRERLLQVRDSGK